jgi:serpin B
MKAEDQHFLYFENDLFQAVKLPFGTDQKYSMLVLLPKNLDINDLMGKFDIINWQNWIDSHKARGGTLYLPEFEIGYGESMSDTLKIIGMVLPSDALNADFSGLSEDGISKLFYIDNVIHKTYVNVDNEGLENPPATPTPTPEPRTKRNKITPAPEDLPFIMDVNKPFFFSVINNETQANLLVGIVRDL